MLDVIFLDFETTGLDPENDEILEAFAQRVTVGAEGAVTRHERFHWLGGLEREVRELPLRVREMHEASGLLAALAAVPTWTRYRLNNELDAALAAFLPDGAVLAGRSIHFDRSFIHATLPLSYEKLHHRMLDVTGLVTLAETVGIVPPPGAIPAPNHRAEGDTAHAIESLRYLTPLLFLGGAVWREYKRARLTDGASGDELVAAARRAENRAPQHTDPVPLYPPPTELASTIPPPADHCGHPGCAHPGCVGGHTTCQPLGALRALNS
jgi:oligoribonuclease